MPTPDGDLLYPRLAAFLYTTPWALEPSKFAVLDTVLRLRMGGTHVSAEEIAAVVGQRRSADRRPAPQGVAVIGVHGVIAQHGGLLAEASGGVSTESLTQSLRLAMADPDVGAIILDVDSPGGSVFGVQELADEIAASHRIKPILAVANASAASAAYWLAASAGEVSVTPSGEVGSIGVLAAHEDVSALQQKLGVQTSLVTAGTFKGEGNPYQPLTDAAKEALQARVDQYYGSFTRAVARGRKTTVEAVRTGMGEGRMVGAQDAVRLGMADRVESLDHAIQRVAASLATGTPVGARAEPFLPPIAATSGSIFTPADREMFDRLQDAADAAIVFPADADDPSSALDAAAGPTGSTPLPTVVALRRRRLALRARGARS